MIREKLIHAGVKNLQEFGYEHCNNENILTDEVYSQLFASMLSDNKGHIKVVDEVIDELLKEIYSA